MHKVVTINLNGQAYQFDEDAYEAIHAYLDRAEAQLHDNPDRAEILADLEQAIADKCRRYLNAHKTVIAAGEIRQVLEEMGPVEGTSDTSQQKAGDSTSAPGE
jgi:CHASE3 domain sensor protein